MNKEQLFIVHLRFSLFLAVLTKKTGLECVSFDNYC